MEDEMKRSAILFFILLLSFIVMVNTASGQLGFRTGIKLGYNYATMTGDNLPDVDSRSALAGGIGLEFNFLSLLSLQVDVLYSPRGASLPNDGEMKLNYISVPMVLKKKFFPVGLHPYLLGGPEFNFLLSAKENGNDIKDQVTSEDLHLVVGGGLEFSFLGKSAYVEGRYSYGLNNINEDGEGELKNRVSQLYFGILF
jgi:hypothetical protein